MKLSNFARGLIGNVGVKLIALVVALVVWFNASGQQEVKRNYAASLSYANLSDTLTTTGPVPSEVQISVFGTRRELLFLGFKRIPMIVNMARATPGQMTYRLAVNDLLLPPGVAPGDIRIIAPTSIDLTVERLVTKRLSVFVALSGTLAEDLLLNHAPVARPFWIKVSGAESAVTPLERITTKQIDLSHIHESAAREVELDYDREALTCTPDKVIVNIAVSPRATRVLANVPPTILMDSQNLHAEVSPKTVSLTLEGPKAMIDTLKSGDVSILANLTAMSPGTYVLAPEVILPDGIERYEMDVDSLRVVISRSPSARSM